MEKDSSKSFFTSLKEAASGYVGHMSESQLRRALYATCVSVCQTVIMYFWLICNCLISDWDSHDLCDVLREFNTSHRTFSLYNSQGYSD